MRVRYPFAGAFAALILMAGYLGLSEMRISAINDKILHFVIFFLLTATLYWAVELPRRVLMKLVLGASVGLSVASELVQGLLDNGRDFDPADIAANLLGSFLALALCQWYHKRMLERRRTAKLQGYGLVEGGVSGPEDLELGEGDLELGEGPGPAVDESGIVAEDDEDEDGAWDDLDGNNDGNGIVGGSHKGGEER